MHGLVALALVCVLQGGLGAPAGDKIASLPGWAKPLPSAQYSGYLNASATKVSRREQHARLTGAGCRRAHVGVAVRTLGNQLTGLLE